MKTKEEIHKAIAVLTLLAMKTDGNTSKRARKMCSALCWVMDYPNDFGKFMEKVDQLDIMGELDLTTDKLERIIKDSVEAVMGRDDEGHSE